MSEATLPVTVALPVKNEEANIAKCLARLGRFSEIIVIDSGSTDRTREIAEGFGARIVQFEWDGKFPKKRNWFLMNEGPKHPWVLFLDADEFIDDAFCDALAEAVRDNSVSGYWLNYTNYFLGKRLDHGVTQRKLAMFRYGRGLYEKIDEDGWSALDMEIHEHPIIEGKVGEISAPIDHRDYKGIGKFIERHMNYALWEARRYALIKDDASAWEAFTPRQRFKYRNISKWWYSTFYFLFTYVLKGGFLDGSAGYHYAAYKAWYFRTIRLLIREQIQ
ncbi:glycosyltransferase family 2 protein [Tropicimonas sediminicola]|uniref:Glycosyltransferase involved in cell wall bisynthesis n=1 Tax=Tropicimonas sediminicola TaxID=1031541 RepID=A0A239M279_9RHOB|nr:glycosyltransferase family 2 protein [Tropicimonas sediminicola]SNT36877.1 Glycosyltransferase involved in cell wall bisynthesis [Tropicimonas sediminicola]